MADGAGGDETVGTELVSGGMAGAWELGLQWGGRREGCRPCRGGGLL